MNAFDEPDRRGQIADRERDHEQHHVPDDAAEIPTESTIPQGALLRGSRVSSVTCALAS